MESEYQVLNSMENVATRHGDISVFTQDNPIAQALAIYGEWAQIEIDFLSQFIPLDGIVLDVGSHVGIHTRAFANIATKGKVYAFEPNPQLVSLLLKNTEILSSRVIIYPLGVGNKKSTAFIEKFSGREKFNAGAASLHDTASEADIAVRLITIDSLRLTRVDFIKLDIEGYEPLALMGAKNTISSTRPVVYCEINSLQSAAKIFEVVASNPYTVYFVSTAAFNPDNYNSSTVNVFGYAHETALLLIPPDRPQPHISKATVCTLVANIDELATLFISAPRYGDRTAHDRDHTHLSKELEVARDEIVKFSAFKENYRSEKIQIEAQLKNLDDIKLQAEFSKGVISLLKQERDVLTPPLVSRQRSTQKRNLRGILARLISRSQLTVTHKILRKSGLFDRDWYLKNNPDVQSSDLDPLAHYILYGAYEGRDPCFEFDSSLYLDTYPMVRISGINPLLHFIEWGSKLNFITNSNNNSPSIRDGRFVRNKKKNPLLKFFMRDVKKVSKQTFRPSAPPWEHFIKLSEKFPSTATKNPKVDVIVPVFRGYDDTLACIMSVLTSNNKTQFELVVIDDASPDRKLSLALQKLSELRLITLIKSEKNLGFVATVNIGMKLHPDRDVILLNSDTLVFNDWVDRLRAHSRQPHVATVTPFTNNGTICSYPCFCEDNLGEFNVSFSDLDKMARSVNQGEYAVVPTGVGFCMYITAEAISSTGLFDVETFGKGYGEENDFCLRVSENHLLNVHALDVFVFHSGETSFGVNASRAKDLGFKALISKHPNYPKIIDRYIKLDPARMSRARLDIARLLNGSTRNLILCVSHTWGGGIDRYLSDRANLGATFLLLVPDVQGTGIIFTSVDRDLMIDTKLKLTSDLQSFMDLLKPFVFKHIEVHSTVGWSSKIFDFVCNISREMDLDFEFTIHDYVTICPQITLINETNAYCGELGKEQCRKCMRILSGMPSKIHPDIREAKMYDIADWRKTYRKFLADASKVIAPSFDVARRLANYYPEITTVVRPHIEPPRKFARTVAVPYDNGTLRVVIIGAIGTHKGSNILMGCVDDAKKRKLPIEFCVVGYSNIPGMLARNSVLVTGRYDENDVFDRLSEVKAHIAFLPSVWPETYSYTLTIALEAGFPTFVFDFGAPAERLRDLGKTTILPKEFLSRFDLINDALLEFHSMKTSIL